jgi:hypothetical protein
MTPITEGGVIFVNLDPARLSPDERIVMSAVLARFGTTPTIRRYWDVQTEDWSRWASVPDPDNPRYAEAARITGEVLVRATARQ